MINDVIADPLTVANQLRPVLLRLARELRKETETLGVTARQVTLLWLIRTIQGSACASWRRRRASRPPLSPAMSTVSSAQV